ncbi:YesN/AraC family two-component response regulator [Paenibacillus sp. V4I3]|uniref:AraC family transcriptional regulator n=1 Tax=unclassified Paenibacillus TaxID=185978 RepID=UPI00277F3E1C|nr:MULTISPECIES: AraC family transcriptional regulator [unclassified Paenibacillus]MDQ0874627.1 YesN/AraC family two-component response regulator [Paenibacillus sp. V4I3]MDQ0889622.1 YesN/AraC family two-component response regulator [Paenibacillus sp. V4I9]
MKFFEDVELQKIPYRFSYRKITTEDYKGFYHCHQGMEFLYVLQGTGQIVVNRKVYLIQPGTFLYLQPYQLHHIQVDVHPDAPYERTIIALEPSIFEHYFAAFPQLNDYFQHLWKNELEDQVLQQMDNMSFINQLFQHHHTVFSSYQHDAKQQNFALLMLQVFQFLYAKGFGDPIENGLHPQRQLHYSEKIMNWLEGHYSEEISLDKLAEHMHISKYYVSRIFKQETGSTLMEYILARRIKQACLLLNTSNKGIEQISIEVGMNNFPYFCQAFKKLVGTTPMKYRKKLR